MNGLLILYQSRWISRNSGRRSPILEKIISMMNNDDIMDIYTIDQVSEVLFANILPLISRSLTVGPKKNRLGVGWANDEDNSFMQKCKRFFYAMLIHGRVFVIVVKTSLTKIPSKHGDVLLIAIMLQEREALLDTELDWGHFKRGDSSVMFEIPKETTRNKPFFFLLFFFKVIHIPSLATEAVRG